MVQQISIINVIKLRIQLHERNKTCFHEMSSIVTRILYVAVGPIDILFIMLLGNIPVNIHFSNIKFGNKLIKGLNIH